MSTSLRNHLSPDQVRIERRLPDFANFETASTYRMYVPEDVGRRLAETVYHEMFESGEFYVVNSQFAVSWIKGRRIEPSPWSEKTEDHIFAYFYTDEGSTVSVHWTGDKDDSLVQISMPPRFEDLDYTRAPSDDEHDWIEAKGLFEFIFSVLD